MRTLLFGATGAIGGAIREALVAEGREVTACARVLGDGQGAEDGWVSLDPFAPSFSMDKILRRGPFDSVIWAQGMNGADTVYDVDADENVKMYKANCLYILVTLKCLLAQRGLVGSNARLVVVSSIWQNIARQNKLSYTMTKAALRGLVQSASVDLAKDQHVINAILPGPLDTPMTRQNLSEEQLKRLENATLFSGLPQLEDVVRLAAYLSSDGIKGITGQFIAVDLGFSHVRLV